MTSGSPQPMTIHRAPLRRRRLAGLVVVIATVAVACDQLLAPAPPATPTPVRSPERAPLADPPPVVDDGLLGAAGLDPALRGALRRAAADAAAEGVVLRIDSGRRSPQQQQRLLDEAVVRHGSVEEAARWVATPDRSAHVSGDAVDIGPAGAAAWLSARGAEHGLCQVYANEPWHYELRPQARAQGCPPMYADPTHDPRLRP